jgi:hypothetical protein
VDKIKFCFHLILTHSFKISNAVIATSISIPESICCFPNFKEKQKRKGKGKRKSIIFTNLLWLLTTMIHLKKQSLYTPCIAFTHLLYIPFIYPLYYNHLFTHFTTTIFACFLYLLSMYRLIIYPFIILQLYSSIAFDTYNTYNFDSTI